MIIDGLFMVVALAGQAIMDLSPVVSFPNNGWASDLAVVIHSENAFNQVLPIEAILVCLAASMVYLTASTVYNGVMWVIRKVSLGFVS